MSELQSDIPEWVIHNLDRVPNDQAVLVLLRHSVRESLPPGEVGYDLPITAGGRRLALELGERARGRLRTLHASPLPRCVQTAEALGEGARTKLTVVPDRLLGDPGVFVVDDQVAWRNWQRLGHEGVVRHLIAESKPLPGMAEPKIAAHALLQHMTTAARSECGLHFFISHDVIVAATVSWLLGVPLESDEWPWYLEGAFFWQEGAALRGLYRNHSAPVQLGPQ